MINIDMAAHTPSERPWPSKIPLASATVPGGFYAPDADPGQDGVPVYTDPESGYAFVVPFLSDVHFPTMTNNPYSGIWRAIADYTAGQTIPQDSRGIYLEAGKNGMLIGVDPQGNLLVTMRGSNQWLPGQQYPSVSIVDGMMDTLRSDVAAEMAGHSKCAKGSYTGNGSVSRQIPMGFAAKLTFIYSSKAELGIALPGGGFWFNGASGTVAAWNVGMSGPSNDKLTWYSNATMNTSSVSYTYYALA